MKNINVISLLIAILAFTSCGDKVCKETIEDLSLTEKGLCGICLGDKVSEVAKKIGDVNPADYTDFLSCKFREERCFNGIEVVIIAAFKNTFMVTEYNGESIWIDDYTEKGGTYELTLGISCSQMINKKLAGKRMQLYDAICSYYRKHDSLVFEDENKISSFFSISASSSNSPNSIVVLQDEENEIVIVLINNDESTYENWINGEL